MAEQKIKKGDIVTLKSGGPRMTVQAIDSNDLVEVSYYTTKGGLETKSFPIDALKNADDTAYPNTIRLGR